MARKANPFLMGSTPINDLVHHPLFDRLGGGPMLVVYLRLIAAHDSQRTRRFHVSNRELWKDPRTAGKMLKQLEQLSLIRVYLGASAKDRRIEIVR